MTHAGHNDTTAPSTQLAHPRGWLAAIFAAIIGLRRRQMDDVARVLWVILIVMVPLLGALAFFIMQPGAAERRDRAHE